MVSTAIISESVINLLLCACLINICDMKTRLDLALLGFVLLATMTACQQADLGQTYTSEELGYTLSYPLDWDAIGSEWDPNVLILQTPASAEESYDGYTLVDVRINSHEGEADLPGNPSGASIEDWLESPSNSYIDLQSYEAISINGMDGLRVIVNDSFNETEYTTHFLKSEDLIHEIYFSNDASAEEHLIYEEVLNSFSAL
jgi:hypothetical protein